MVRSGIGAACSRGDGVRYRLEVLSVVAFTLVCSACAIASSPSDADTTLTGNWGGTREDLHNRGIDLSLGYTGEFASNVSGGPRQAYAYADQLAIGASFDFDKLFGWSGGSLHADIAERSGMVHALEERAAYNALLESQDIYGGGRVTRLVNFYVEQKLWNGAVDVKLGRMAIGVDFYTFSCRFQNLSFCASLPSWVASGLNEWPLSQIGGAISVHPFRAWYLKAGVFKVNKNNAAPSNGLRLFPKGKDDGTLLLGEMGIHTHVAGPKADPSASGTWSIGVWRNTAKYPDLVQSVSGASQPVSGMQSLIRESGSGIYLVGQQQITQNQAGGGITLFANFVRGNSNIDLVDRMVSVGLFINAPFSIRPHDQINIAVGRDYISRNATLAARLHGTGGSPVTGHQDVAEFDYAARLHPGVVLMPNVQYIRRPGGISDQGDVTVLGCRLDVAF